jgi:copper chaperone
MQELTFDVPGVSCEHCVNSITKATKELGVSDVKVDLPSKKVFVAFDPAAVTEPAIKAAIEDEG